MINIYKVNTGMAFTNILIFVLEVFWIGSADFSGNKGTSKDIALLSFIFLYGWLLVPPVVTIVFYGYRKKRKIFDTVLLFVNGIILIYNVPMLIAYLNGT